MASQTSGIHSADASRKSRATSCTECRQVKLKCDLRDRYPSPCSRCHRNKLDCRTDATFKRVPARSRIKYLENEISHLRRARALEQVSNAQHSEVGPTTSSMHKVSIDDISQKYVSEQTHTLPVRTSVSTSSDPGTSPRRALLVLNETDALETFILGNVVMPYADALVLMQTFESAFYPHFACLEQITSLQSLYERDSLLFWTMITLSAVDHARLSCYHVQLRDHHSRLIDDALRGSLSSLSDLQAMLIMSDWPNYRKGILLRDSQWHRLGAVIFAARQMGLDREKQEGFLGVQQNLDALWKHSRYTRRMTWLKCFESDALWSAWYGHLPTIALPGQLDRILSVCQDSIIPRDYAGLIEILVAMTRHTIAFSDGLVSAPTAMMIRAAKRDLEAVRTRYGSTWSVKSELYFLAAQNNLYTIALVMLHVADPSREERRTSDLLYTEIITAARQSAVEFADLATNLGKELLNAPSLASLAAESQPFAGWPKTFSQMLYFTGCVLIKYLDSALDAKPDDIEATRNAYGRMYQLSTSCARTEENLGLAAAFEVAGRAVVDGSFRLKTRVTSRLAASLYHNVSWMAVKQRDPLAKSDDEDDEEDDEEEQEETELSTTVPSPTNPAPLVSLQHTQAAEMRRPVDMNASADMHTYSFPQSAASLPNYTMAQPRDHSQLDAAALLHVPMNMPTVAQPPPLQLDSRMHPTPMTDQLLRTHLDVKPTTTWESIAPAVQANDPFPFGNWNHALYDQFLATVQNPAPEESYQFQAWVSRPP